MKFDLHVHSYYSRDAINAPEHLLKLAKAKGMGFALTDHNTIEGWQEFKELNKRYSIPIIFGEEIKIYSGKKLIGELLAYFLQEEVQRGQYENVIDKLKQQDALVSIAHPFDPLRAPLFASPKRFDLITKNANAVEVFNSRCYFTRFNSKAKSFAEKNRLAFTAGSDAHLPEEFGNACVELEGSSEEELRKSLLRCNNFSGKLSRKRVHIYTAMRKKGIIKAEKTGWAK